ncbi:MAG: FecR domain-containing protein [Planctomycetota bacterium]
MTPVSCSLVERWIELSLDGELSDELELQLDEHLDGCDSCRAQFEAAFSERRLLDGELEQLSGAFDSLLADRMTEESIERFEILDSSDRMREERESRRRSLRRVAALFLIGSVVFVVGWGASHLSSLSERSSLASVEWTGAPPRFTDLNGVTEVPDAGTRAVGEYDEVSVASGSSVRVVYSDGTEVTVDGPSRFELREEVGRREFRLHDGIAGFRVQPSPGGFIVGTRLAVVRVVGTQFVVQHDDARDKTGVIVEEGEVEVWRRARPRRLRLRAGDLAKISPRSIQVTAGAIAVDPAPPAGESPSVVPEGSQSAEPGTAEPGADPVGTAEGAPRSEPESVDRPARPGGLDVPVSRPGGGRR